jgi:hypothetical protein
LESEHPLYDFPRHSTILCDLTPYLNAMLTRRHLNKPYGQGNVDAADRDQIDDLLVVEKFARFFESSVAYYVILR